MESNPLGCALLALALLAGPAPGVAEPDAVGLEVFRGRWVIADRAAADAARDAEIVRVTEPMAFVFRGFARALMRRMMQPPEAYEIGLDGEAWSVRSSDGPEYVLDGRAQTGDGDEQVTSRFEDGAIRQRWRHGEGSHGATLWELDAAGERLTVTEEVHDARFEGSMRYATRYRRESGASAGSR